MTKSIQAWAVWLKGESPGCGICVDTVSPSKERTKQYYKSHLSSKYNSLPFERDNQRGKIELIPITITYEEPDGK